MGCYGIGVSRLLSAIIEQHHDEKGMIWTQATAPFDVDIMVSNIKDSAQLEMGEKIYTALNKEGIECLLDDRAERYGAKISDFELIGFPFGIIIGKGLEKGEIELVRRKDLSREVLKVSDFIALIAELKEWISKCH